MILEQNAQTQTHTKLSRGCCFYCTVAAVLLMLLLLRYLRHGLAKQLEVRTTTTTFYIIAVLHRDGHGGASPSLA